MSTALRGRGGMTFEQTLGVLADAATRELPEHLASVQGGRHSIDIQAFIRGIGSRVYTIDNVVNHKTGQHWYRYTSHQRTADPGSPISVWRRRVGRRLHLSEGPGLATGVAEPR